MDIIINIDYLIEFQVPVLLPNLTPELYIVSNKSKKMYIEELNTRTAKRLT